MLPILPIMRTQLIGRPALAAALERDAGRESDGTSASIRLFFACLPDTGLLAAHCGPVSVYSTSISQG
jgi:hypothetical protein